MPDVRHVLLAPGACRTRHVRGKHEHMHRLLPYWQLLLTPA
jgi:hypothetical protein